MSFFKCGRIGTLLLMLLVANFTVAGKRRVSLTLQRNSFPSLDRFSQKMLLLLRNAGHLRKTSGI
jgi:hypothetical protein